MDIELIKSIIIGIEEKINTLHTEIEVLHATKEEKIERVTHLEVMRHRLKTALQTNENIT